jgi:hypothetical protein
MGEEYSDKGEKPDEIEITPEMVEAGAAALSRYRYERGNETDVVGEIYRAMKAVKDRHR